MDQLIQEYRAALKDKIVALAKEISQKTKCQENVDAESVRISVYIEIAADLDSILSSAQTPE